MEDSVPSYCSLSNKVSNFAYKFIADISLHIMFIYRVVPVMIPYNHTKERHAPITVEIKKGGEKATCEQMINGCGIILTSRHGILKSKANSKDIFQGKSFNDLSDICLGGMGLI